jgi:hypothetical protein
MCDYSFYRIHKTATKDHYHSEMKALTLILVTSAVLTTSCGGTPKAASVSGNWRFFVSSQKLVGSSGTGNGALVQSGRTVRGTLNFTGACTTTTPLAGTLEGNTFAFQLTQHGQPASFTGTISNNFSHASGSWTTTLGGCVDGDFGTWFADKN